jgi:hypothetical protein
VRVGIAPETSRASSSGADICRMCAQTVIIEAIDASKLNIVRDRIE